MKSNLKLTALATAGLLALTAGCGGDKPDMSTIPPPPPQPVPHAVAATPTPTPAAATPEAAASTTNQAPPPTEVGGPAVAALPDVGYDAAKPQKGYAEVKKLGRNPLGDGAATADKGKPLFLQNCAPCHGQQGLGDGPAGAALDPKPRNQTAYKEYKYGYGDLGIFRTVKYGTEGTGMAGWDGRMKDNEIWEVVAYVRSIQKP